MGLRGIQVVSFVKFATALWQTVNLWQKAATFIAIPVTMKNSSKSVLNATKQLQVRYFFFFFAFSAIFKIQSWHYNKGTYKRIHGPEDIQTLNVLVFQEQMIHAAFLSMARIGIMDVSCVVAARKVWAKRDLLCRTID